MRLRARAGAVAVAAALLIAAAPPSPANGHEADVVPVADPYALIDPSRALEAANQKLVLDYARIVLEAGHFEEIDRFIAPDYVQHSPSMPPGRDGLVAFFRKIFPRRAIEPKLRTPIFSMIAQGELVMVGQPIWPIIENGKTRYRGSHFDLFRVVDGRIVEHWDSIDALAPPVP